VLQRGLLDPLHTHAAAEAGRASGKTKANPFLVVGNPCCYERCVEPVTPCDKYLPSVGMTCVSMMQTTELPAPLQEDVEWALSRIHSRIQKVAEWERSKHSRSATSLPATTPDHG